MYFTVFGNGSRIDHLDEPHLADNFLYLWSGNVLFSVIRTTALPRNDYHTRLTGFSFAFFLLMSIMTTFFFPAKPPALIPFLSASSAQFPVNVTQSRPQPQSYFGLPFLL